MMSNFKRHLSLVSSDKVFNNILEGEKFSCNQLSFSFDKETTLLLVLEKEISHGKDFAALLRDNKPTWLFDIRVSPRLDFVASNRALAFQIFDNLDISYIDVIGVMGIDCNNHDVPMPEIWSDLVVSKLKQKNNNGSVILFVFDNERVFRRAQYVLPSIVNNVTGVNNSKIRIVENSNSSLIAM